MLGILADGLEILNLYKAGILIFLVTIFGLGSFILSQVKTRDLERGMMFLGSFSIGAIALSVVTYFIAWIGHFLPSLYRPASLLVLGFAIFAILRGIWLGNYRGTSSLWLAGVLSGLLLLLVARLSYLDHILLPSYSDSPIHFQIISDLLHPGGRYAINLSIGNTFTHYYHLGFHAETAWLSSITGIAPEDGISLLGQILLVLAPISIIFLTWQLTGSVGGALFAGLLSAAAWDMPAFAVNWGKFPALISLATLPAALAFIGIFLPGRLRDRKVILFSLMLAAGLMLLHTRILVCVLLAVGAVVLSYKLMEHGDLGFFQALRLSLLYILSMIPIFQPILDFYSGIPSLMVWIVLLPFAFQSFPRVSLAVVLFTLAVWFTALVPPLLMENGPELIDRQFLEILLYIPFSVLGGAGFTGMLKKLTARPAARTAVAITLAVFASLIFLKGDSLLPDGCCLYYTSSDQSAFHWLEKNTSPGDLVLISTMTAEGTTSGTDSGIWIQPLLGRSTNKFPYDTNWNLQRTAEEICASTTHAIFIYAGGRNYSFRDSILSSGTVATLVFSSGDTNIYKYTGCP